MSLNWSIIEYVVNTLTRIKLGNVHVFSILTLSHSLSLNLPLARIILYENTSNKILSKHTVLYINPHTPFSLQFSPQHSHPSGLPETINKTVLTFDISLYNSTAAWLGITVYGKSSTSRKAGDMGIYIKSITPGGAAAMVSISP